MSARAQCHCQSCTLRGLTGPAVVVTIGVLFLLHQLKGGSVDFGNTWPMILVVIGFLYLASALASHDGHVETTIVPVPPAPPANPVPPAPPQPPYGQPGQ